MDWMQFTKDMEYLLAHIEDMSEENKKFVEEVNAKIGGTDTMTLEEVDVKKIRHLCEPGVSWK